MQNIIACDLVRRPHVIMGTTTVKTMRLTLIIPMAGQGVRFGSVFKPFIQIDGRTFIEHALDGFADDARVTQVLLVVTEQQNKAYNVSSWVATHMNDKVRVIAIPAATSGPLQTVVSALQTINQCNLEHVVICDCDHSVDPSPLWLEWESCIDNRYDAVLTTWNIDPSQHKSWGTVTRDKRDGCLVSLQEKVTMPESSGQETLGVIGCHFVRRATDICGSLAPDFTVHFESMRVKGARINLVSAVRAGFFGTPDLLREYVAFRRTMCTVLCDVDGVIVQHDDQAGVHTRPLVADNVIFLKKRRQLGDRIVLLTARHSKFQSELEAQLKEGNVPYDTLVMGAASGPRLLVNDSKPALPYADQAMSITTDRNGPIGTWNLPPWHYDACEYVIHSSPSATVAAVRRSDGELIVRKSTSSGKANVLRSQCKQMRALYELAPMMFPVVLNEVDGQRLYWYDIPVVSGATGSFADDKVGLATSVFRLVSRNVHRPTRIASVNTLSDYVDAKIMPRLDPDNNSELRRLVQELSECPVACPTHVARIHGDLTLSNVMVDANGQVTLIDATSYTAMEPPELDLAKLCQSVVENYEHWATDDDILTDGSSLISGMPNTDLDDPMLDPFFDCAAEELQTSPGRARMLAAMHLAFHLVRMSPYQLEQHGLARARCVLFRALCWAREAQRRQISLTQHPTRTDGVCPVSGIEIFYDGVDVAHAPPWVTGFTTNPVLLSAAGVKILSAFVSSVVDETGDRPLSIQVPRPVDVETVVADGLKIAGLAPSVVVKVPIVSPSGELLTSAICRLRRYGIAVNATAVFTRRHVDALSAVLTGSSTPAIISIFGGRINDAGVDATGIVRYAVATFLDRPHVRILWASCRTVWNVLEARDQGAHIVTVPLSVIARMSRLGEDPEKVAVATVAEFASAGCDLVINCDPL